MSVPVFEKLSMPRLLLYGNFKATIVNLGVSVIVGIMLAAPIPTLVILMLVQVAIARKTKKNLFFFEEREMYIKSKNTKAMTEKGEIYV